MAASDQSTLSLRYTVKTSDDVQHQGTVSWWSVISDIIWKKCHYKFPDILSQINHTNWWCLIISNSWEVNLWSLEYLKLDLISPKWGYVCLNCFVFGQGHTWHLGPNVLLWILNTVTAITLSLLHCAFNLMLLCRKAVRWQYSRKACRRYFILMPHSSKSVILSILVLFVGYPSRSSAL